MIALATFLALAAPAPASQEGADAAKPAPVAPAAEKGTPPVLARRPETLPRAEPGRWEGLFEGTELSEQLLDSLDVATPVLLETAGKAYLEADYLLALDRLWRVLELDPDLPPALLLLGNTYFRLRRYGDSAVALERFLEHAPSQAFRTQALAHDLYSLGDYERALEHYRRVIAGMEAHDIPVSPDARRGLGLTYMRLGDEEQALEELRAVLAARPTDGDTQRWIARILFDRDELEPALEAVRAAQELRPYDPRVWFLLSNVLLELDREEEAAAARARWQELDRVAQAVRSIEGRMLFTPRDYGLAVELIGLHASVGDVASVRENVQHAIDWRPPQVSELELLLFVLGVVEGLGDWTTADQAAARLHDVYGDLPEVVERLTLYELKRDAAGPQGSDRGEPGSEREPQPEPED